MKRKEKQTGIYKITNTLNGKMYVGSAVNIIQRWHLHRSHLRRNKHHSIVLQRAWDKYGEDNFSFEILELCESDSLILKEQVYLDNLTPQYNICKQAGSCLGVKFSKESSVKKSLNSSKRGKFGKECISSHIIYQYSLEGNFLKEWYGCKEIERELGFDAANVLSGIKNDRTPYGFYWTKTFLGDTINPRKKNNRDKTCKKIGMFGTDGTLLKEFKSQKDALIFLNKNPKQNASINDILRNKHGHHTAYGFKWKYL